MTIEDFRTELEILVSGLTNSGFNTIDAGLIEEINKLVFIAEELGMKKGKLLLENLSGTMNAIKEGKSTAESGNVRLLALDFYVKKLSSGEKTEDL